MTSTKERKLLPLLPKPEPIQYKLCGLPACRRQVCNLVSHRQYATMIKNRRRATRLQTDNDKGVGSQLQLVDPPLEPIVGGFPILPSDSLDLPITRQLFHDFIVKVSDRVHMLLVPPGDRKSDQAWLERRRRDLFYLGSANMLDCINCVLAAYIHLAPRSATVHVSEADSMGLQATLVRNLRNTLNNYHPSDSVRVLSTISTLVMVEYALGRKTSLLAHRTAMIRIVDSCGGIQNQGFAIPLILNLDKNISMQIGEPPVYVPWSSVNTPIQRVPRYPQLYGSFFSENESKAILSEDVAVYCAEACRAIEILENEKWTFNYAEYKHSTEIYYLYFLRGRLSGKFAHLNARCIRSSSPERCVLLATKIVEYMTLTDNTLPAIPRTVAQNLYEILKSQTTTNSSSDWTDWPDVLSWILSVLVSVPGRWEGRNWAVALHHNRLNDEYGEIWPDDWEQSQLSRMRRFVWSATRLDAMLAVGSGRAYNSDPSDVLQHPQ